ncbi:MULTISPECIES: efflux RND transporter periplasmic adaptor subunit [Pseudomonadaceae]|jgi:RND family efflux transporter MFP subunit|uniref:RND family efflux transporter, MFP subunit n=1 Tax=Pseudomonas oryzihabitans TaxID=47885 RepID=A0A1G5MJA4_9PSED|nr:MULTISPECIES: HlyD family secretion protein [Pseudomonas]KIZ51870.1 membrane protein [Pseudomonas oryzihabitans]KTT53797.1 membrane protein [Pseudomonas psychrotolerans]MCI1007631.1 HlyD family secretion protein [Pseudomonas oryzihabitans]NMY88294.1 HlyD family secretion protein [Pseudomonas psychrotolerans]NMZ65699.1 HlyD family secretion protein [Pseudomonas oryzihabitans]
MILKKLFGVLFTLLVVCLALILGRLLWVHYMNDPWTRDGRVRAEVITIAPDVAGLVTEIAVRDNQWVNKGDLLLQIDPEHYEIAVHQAEASVAARKATLAMRQQNARRRADIDSLVVSRENREDASSAALAAEADLRQAQAQLESARLNLKRTRVLAPVDGYVTNLSVFKGDYAAAGAPKLAVIDAHSFWVYGYFEETKLPHVRVGAAAEMRLMSGQTLQGHVESIARGIYDRDNPQSRELTADVNPTFNWVRLAQRVPVRIALDPLPEGLLLAAGTTCTVVLEDARGERSWWDAFWQG